ncbi:hypothetical protein [Saccharibacillus brassicae]|uniref:hypothetical protein n=1 Tax=Saccharibacillus brassicae TaxID=2583377 RepID=UPI001BAEC9A0|nr:hypothetical protein [Saccharibacillus brassicae]
MKKFLRVTMPDNSRWDVPAELIAKNRAADYAGQDTRSSSGPEYEKEFQAEFEYAMTDAIELVDWATDNMNWEDVEAHAQRVAQQDHPIDYQEGWVNGEKEIVEYDRPDLATNTAGMQNKFIVVKRTDVSEFLPQVLQDQQEDILRAIEVNQIVQQVTPASTKTYLVVNTDEPYADEVIAILKRHGHWG